MVHRAASATRRRHCEPVASESAAAQTSAATQPSAEAALARAAVSSEQSEGRVKESTHAVERTTGAMDNAGASHSEREPPQVCRAVGEGERRCRTSAAKQPGTEAALARAAVSGEQGEGQLEESASTDVRSKCAMGDDVASRSEREPPPAWRAGGEREHRRADERGDAAERRDMKLIGGQSAA